MRSTLELWALGVLLFCCLLAPAGCSGNYNHTSDKVPIVRVRLMSNQEQVTVAAKASPIVTSMGDNQPRRLDFPGGVGVPVTLSPAGWRVGNSVFAAGELIFEPDVMGSVSVNGATYRGRYRFVPTTANRFDVINDVDVDSYLMSVVPSEMLPDWEIEAYKAQAIAARTYALYEANTAGSGRPFDVDDDTRSQVYGGLAAESEKSRQAVLETAGVVVAYGEQGHEKIFKAYFSSCCGGVGQSAYEAFGDPDIPPLREKYVGPMCNASSRFNWGPVVIKRDELTRRIRIWGARRNLPQKDMATLARIDIASVNRYRRPVSFIITDVKNRRYSMSGEDLRTACNADAPKDGPTLNSSFCTPLVDRDTIRFVEGHGWGHGVGMCQWCAEARALKGQRHEDIVRLAYPGAVLVLAY
ncbi:MAG TPA: SpoIID/LytB domain-containing protein [Tepidisphaeraceae bacterium]